MPIGVITSEDLQKELDRFTPSNSKIIDKPKLGRNGVKEIPEGIRKLIAGESLQGVPAKQLQEVFPISQSSISAYKEGATSTASIHNPNPELKKHTDNIKNQIGEAARGRLFKALNSMTDDKIAEAPLKVASQVVRDMSAVIKDMLDKDNEGGTTVNFTFVSVPPADEDKYAVIDIGESK